MKDNTTTEGFLTLEFSKADLEIIKRSLLEKAARDLHIQPARIAKLIEQELHPEKYPAMDNQE
tara:strand:+ start:570 stop:758 length:189 start_codon:yes stop_codon:yes gene_type:complete